MSNNQELLEKLKQAGLASGLSKETINDEGQAKKAESLLEKLNPEQAARLSDLLSNPEAIKKMMATAQAQALLKKFLESK